MSPNFNGQIGSMDEVNYIKGTVK